jgi:hypothetical protein
LKSNVSEILEIVSDLYKDICSQCIADVSDPRDLTYVRSRVEEEGESFLTITLPSFASDFERSLEIGYIDSNLFRAFRKRNRRSIPSFLQGMTSRIFNSETGRLLNEEHPHLTDDCASLVKGIRQFCLFFKKAKILCTPKRVKRALVSFIDTEHFLSTHSPSKEDSDYFNRVSRVLWDNVANSFDISSVVPRHGPGATADGILGNQKYAWQRWHSRLDDYFPMIEFALTMGALDSEEYRSIDFVEPELEQPVKVTPVPKTLKGPRIIAIEPVCMQYAQQAISRYLIDFLESYWFTKGHVNFTDQSVNQDLALVSSFVGRLATIDLSDASDRVPRSLAMDMFRSNPFFQGAIDSCRSRKAYIRELDITVELSKFASMGSALCFPIESMYFYTICVAALLRYHNLPVSGRHVFRVSRDIYVYGDDIVVPSASASTVSDYLQRYLCKVNSSKSFWTGRFRESCGVEAYCGYRVTPVYLRYMPPRNRRQVSEIISYVSTANALYSEGYVRTASRLFSIVERYLGPLPYVPRDSQALGRITWRNSTSIGRWNVDFQRFEFRAWVPEIVHRSDELSGYHALFKSLSHLQAMETLDMDRDEMHLERSARRGVVALKRRWVPSR